MDSVAIIWSALKILECTMVHTHFNACKETFTTPFSRGQALDDPWFTSNDRHASGKTTSCAADQQEENHVIIAGTRCARR